VVGAHPHRRAARGVIGALAQRSFGFMGHLDGSLRAVFVKWPLGHPLGEAGAATQQRSMIFAALRLLASAEQPGTLYEPGYRWRRENDTEPDWAQLEAERLQ
jgi:D-proline reductase (dithiol) PrdB